MIVFSVGMPAEITRLPASILHLAQTDGGDQAQLLVVEHLDLFPYTPFPKDRGAQSAMLRRHEPYRIELDALIGAARDVRIDAMMADLHYGINRVRGRFDGWRRIQDAIGSKHDAIEFRRAGAITFDLFERRFHDEKCVDVKLATDMIVLKDMYDVAIIVSGDQDYVPAVQVVKDCGKRVVNVCFEARNGRLLPGGARRLNHVTDRAFTVPYADMKAHLKL